MINTIIFDFGGVLGTDSDTIFIKALVKNKVTENQARKIWRKHWPKLKTGEEHVKSIWCEVEKHTTTDINKIIHEYNESISVNFDILDICKKLKQKSFKLGILANESSEWMDIKRKKGNLNKIFDIVYSSADIKTPKPFKESYDKILNSLNSTPEETLFIDNMDRNTIAAEELGIKSILFKDIIDLKNKLSVLLNIEI